MNYKGHLTVGFLCFCFMTVLLLFHQPITLECLSLGLIVCLLGSLAPDLDHKNSKIHRWSYAASIFSGFAIYLLVHKIYLALVIAILLLIVVFTLSRLRHRGITHHLPGLIIFTALIYIAFYMLDFDSPITITMFGAIGYFSHIASDRLKRRNAYHFR